MIKKLEVKPHVLDDMIVQDGLCAVGALEDSPLSKGCYFVVGGVATQSYLPTACRRPTTDIDLAVLMPLSYSEFKAFASPTIDFLKSSGYDTETSKGHNSHQLFYSLKGDAGIIEFARRSPKSFTTISDRLNGELNRSRKKIVEGKDTTYRVASPEDIVVPKLARTVNSLARNPEYLWNVLNDGCFSLTNEGVREKLEQVGNLRAEAVMHVGDPRLAEKLRVVSDLYDIRLLSALAGFNEDHLLQAMQGWSSIIKQRDERKAVFANILPKLSEEFEALLVRAQ